ncbi:MAG: tRNA (adenosine(37)-N6)-dimethylallyltransferase MiaA [bacterium]|nr:tRNA (adenosine(37)-N6)-dimethylallyltransferase MiaA [bacterium]
MNTKPLIVILGSTASGKSDLALRLARKFYGAIVSADSRQIYRGMNIGTAKPTLIERKKVPHYLIDIIKPDEEYSVSLYQKDARTVIQKLHNTGMAPFLVGGTGLYISAVTDGLEIPAVAPNPILRRQLETKTVKELADMLKRKAPKTFSRIDANNPRRLIRALEIIEATGREIPSGGRKFAPYLVMKLGVMMEREELYKRINARVLAMMKQGLVKETKNLLKKYPANLPALSSIGYKEIGQYLKGEISLERAVELIQQATRNYAKRQISWFKRDRSIHWVKTAGQAEKLITRFLK